MFLPSYLLHVFVELKFDVKKDTGNANMFISYSILELTTASQIDNLIFYPVFEQLQLV